ncbi:MAG: hypothetical protein R3C56_17905 [Pirellulaceae bacterium]
MLPVELREILAIAREARTPEQAEQLATHYRSLAPELSSLREQLKQLEAEREQLNESIPSMLVTKTVEPRMVRVLARGNWMDEWYRSASGNSRSARRRSLQCFM